MERAKRFIAENLEKIAVLLVLLGIALMHFFVLDKLPFLGVYYLPVLLAAWACGRRTALLISLLSVLLVVLYAVATLPDFDEELAENLHQFEILREGGAPRSQVATIANEIVDQKFTVFFSLAAWGSFLVLAGVFVGTLHDQRDRKKEELKQAYVAALEMLVKCLESTDRTVSSHSQKVAELAVEVARELNLPESAIQKIRMGGLLHDIGRLEVSLKALQGADVLSQEEREEIRKHPFSSAGVLQSAELVVRDVIPIVRRHHEYFLGPPNEIPDVLPARLDEELRISIGIVAVVDAYDTAITDQPQRPARLPWQAIQEIEASSGTVFYREIVEAFKKVITPKI